MFVVQDRTIGAGSRAAQARFANLLHGNWLAETSQVACEGGAEGLLRVGPAGPAPAGHPAEGASPGWQPAPEPGMP
jgi:hypothetical protein